MKRPFRTTSASLALVGAIALAGCATQPGASYGREDYRAIFTQVITKSFAESKKDNLCLPSLFGYGDTRVETAEVIVDPNLGAAILGPARTNQFRALEAAGLVTGKESERTIGTRTQKVVTYRRTAQGEAVSSGSTFCFARAELDRVVKWKGPIALGEYRAAFVYYTVRSGPIAEWAKAPAMLTAFPTLGPIVRGEPAKERQVAIDLSSEGWDVAEYSKLLQLQ